MHRESQQILGKLVESLRKDNDLKSHNKHGETLQTNMISYKKSHFQQRQHPNTDFKQRDIFKKHQNLVEANKQNLHRSSNANLTDGRIPTQPKKTRNSGRISFTPKELHEIQPPSRFSLQEDPKQQLTPITLQKILVKSHLKSKRSLMSHNILQLENRYNYSRFQLHNLYSIYHTLLLDAHHSRTRFKNGFEVMLNMNRVCLRPQILEKIFHQLTIDNFTHFLEMNNKIDQIVFQQSITDYVEILFESINDKNNIRFDDIVHIFKHRITEKEAIDMSKLVFDQYDRNYEDRIKLQEITEACQASESFAQKMYKLYNRQIKFQ